MATIVVIVSEKVDGATLRTGDHVDISHAGPPDLDVVAAFYAQLDDAATYSRFFGIRRQIPIGELRRVVGAEEGHVTLLARMGRQLVGIGEYIVGAEPTQAEVAFVVADDHHREGVATLLLERLAGIAHDHGLLRLTATVLPDNGDMRRVFRTVGLPTRSTFDSDVVCVTLDVSTLEGLEVAAALRHAESERSAAAGSAPPRK